MCGGLQSEPGSIGGQFDSTGQADRARCRRAEGRWRARAGPGRNEVVSKAGDGHPVSCAVSDGIHRRRVRLSRYIPAGSRPKWNNNAISDIPTGRTSRRGRPARSEVVVENRQSPPKSLAAEAGTTLSMAAVCNPVRCHPRSPSRASGIARAAASGDAVTHYAGHHQLKFTTGQKGKRSWPAT